MRKARYVFSHALTALIVGLLLAATLTNLVWYVLSQRRSVKDGIEIILLDVSLSLGDSGQLSGAIRSRTGVPYVGASSLALKETEQYVATIENYTLRAHIEALARTRDAELLFVPEEALRRLLPLGVELDDTFPADEACLDDGILRAVNVTSCAATDYGATLVALPSDVYALLLPGDHTQEARLYLKSMLDTTD